MAGHVITHQFQSEMVGFYHAALGSPTISTLLRAVDLGYLISLPALTATAIRANRPVTLATDEGRMVRMRQGLRTAT